MEVLSRVLNKAPSGFRFHPKCEQVGLMHLCFLDDLMICSYRDQGSLSFIKDVSVSFEDSEELVFGMGLPVVEEDRLAAFLGFSVVSLLVRYLGVLLLSRRISHHDCKPLLERIICRVRNWSARMLSFASWLLLIRLVPQSFQVYWASVFILPARVLHDVEQILHSFLWKGHENGWSGTKVAWSEISTSSGLFSVSNALDVLRPVRPPVPWFSLVWFGGNIPKHSFIAWLAMRDRLATRDRLCRWDYSVMVSCVFCTGQESWDNLFFECPFSWEVWSSMIAWAGSSRRISYWSTELP
ncbi:uncharacterized protein LOC111024165 [Momordica charantia]|uniref:Uncharacterized protein LOC111024165 n=1 Tax=Momordica charantia TaxID=3673 RepID=A0A6J1DTG0_MOMCH|nr:uncharacterized protein LOC111024165 [Momordica charantia]